MMSEMEANEMTEPETVNAIDLMDSDLSEMLEDYKLPAGMTVENMIDAGKSLKSIYSVRGVLMKSRISRMIDAVNNFDKPMNERGYEISSSNLVNAISATEEQEGGLLHIVKERLDMTHSDVNKLLEAYDGAMFTCPKCGHRGARTYPTIYGDRHCKKCKDKNSFHSWVYEQFNGYNYKFRDYDAENAFLDWRSSLKFQIQTIVNDVPSDKSVEMGYDNAKASVDIEVGDAREVFNKDCNSTKRFVILVWRSDMSDPVLKVCIDKGFTIGHWDGMLTLGREEPEPVYHPEYASGYAIQ